MSIHVTTDGRTFQVVSPVWVRLLTFLVIIGLLAIMALGWTIKQAYSQIDGQNRQTEIWRQRARALNDLLKRRAAVQQWTYEETCRQAKEKGRECMPNPKWWADREQYPLLVNDEAGEGIIGPEDK